LWVDANFKERWYGAGGEEMAPSSLANN